MLGSDRSGTEQDDYQDRDEIPDKPPKHFERLSAGARVNAAIEAWPLL